MDTPGTILRREREARGIPLREIASITRIPVSALRNLEEDRFDLFPAEVFAKGFLRNYARELQISTDDVLLAYQALKQQSRHEPLLPSPTPTPVVTPRAPVAARPEPREETPSRAAAAVSALSRRARRVARREGAQPSTEREPVSPLVLENDGDAAAAGDGAQRTFRFAYLIVFLVVVTSLGLSVLFTGTGEAEENALKRARPVLDDDAKNGSRWLMSDQKLTATRPDAERVVPETAPANDFDFSDDADLEGESSETPEVAPMLPEPAAAPEAESAPAEADPIERWNRPAFPQDDH